jgi:tetratricopeptide (TPR) repeat protein
MKFKFQAATRSVSLVFILWIALLLPCAAQNEESAYEKLIRGDYTGAVQEYSAVLANDPTNISAFESRAVAYDRLGKPELALEDHSKAIALNPKLASAYGNRCLTYTKLNQLDAALADCNLALSLNPQEAGFYLNRAEVRRSQGNYQAAIDDCKQVLAIDPKRKTTAQLFIATLYNQQGKYDLAIPIFTEVIAAAPQTTIAYLRRGEAYYRRNQYENALSDYNKVIATKPDYYPAYVQRVLVYNSYEPSKSIVECQALEGKLLGNELIPLYHYVCGTAYYSNGEEEKAIQEYRNALKSDPKFIEASINLASLQYLRSKYDLALQETSTDSKSAQMRFLRGLILIAKNNGSGAVTEMNKALELGFTDIQLYLYRGEAYSLVGGEDNLKHAVEDFDQFIQSAGAKNEMLASAYSKRGLVKLVTGDLDAAAADFTEVVKRDPDNLSAYNGRGTVFYLQKRYQAAARDFQQAVALENNSGFGYLGWGLALLESRSDLKNAKVYLKASLEPRRLLPSEERTRAYLALAAANVLAGDRQQALSAREMASKSDASSVSCVKSLDRESESCASLKAGLALQTTVWSSLERLNSRPQTQPQSPRPPRTVIIYRTVTLERSFTPRPPTTRRSVLDSIITRKIKL